MHNARESDYVVTQLRSFFKNKKQFIEVPSQTRYSILAACEDPATITTYSMGGDIWPLPQTGQMWLGQELLNNPSLPGAFCITASYRNEPNPIPGRHDFLFPMFEFESRGDIDCMRALERELLQHLGFSVPRCFTYDDMCKRLGVDDLGPEQETKMWEDMSSVISLEFFPKRTHPFFNMKRADDGLYNKIDLILYGMETISSGERSCSAEEMRHDFYTISNGKYAQLLFETFGKDRVVEELEQFLALPMIPRFGGSIGITRLTRAMRLANLFDQDALLSDYKTPVKGVSSCAL